MRVGGLIRWSRIGALAAAAVPLLMLSAGAQARSGAPRGVWEPVSYGEDIRLTSVFFVSRDVGWASGAAGTILHTTDGGATWQAQLGGDPSAADPEIERLHFFDERHGWAVQDRKLLRTTDGETWEEAGALPYAFGEYVFVSPTEGFAAATPATQGNADHVFRTQDGGRTWQPVAPCTVKAVVNGLTREIRCHIERFSFATPSVGYLVASQFYYCTCRWPPIVGKTEDGGATWQFVTGPGDATEAMLQDVFFTGERSGVVYAEGEVGLRKLYATSDGGETWRSVIASPGSEPRIRFADPEVGWAFSQTTMAYTTNGGRSWTSRSHRFPASPRGFSFPRRDRAYVVGDHGMIFRYRVLAGAERPVAGALPAPAMPPLTTPLLSEAEQVIAALDSLGDEPGGSASPAGTATNGGAVAAEPSARLQALDLLLVGLGETVPAFLQRFTNLNLLGARLRSAGELPERLDALRASIDAVRQAGDKASAEQALNDAMAAAEELRASARFAIQQPSSDSAAPSHPDE